MTAITGFFCLGVIMTNAVTEVGEFFNGWNIYRKVLENNYMHHREIYQSIEVFLCGYFAHRPFSLLDLGCGDAGFLAEALRNSAIQHYAGFDLSDPALALATTNIATLNCTASLTNDDFMKGLEHITRPFDVIFTSYALHHLNAAEKAKFFALAHDTLTEGGLLIVIDTVREPEEALPAYLKNYCQWIREEWLAFDPLEIEAIYQHITRHDLPVTAEALYTLAESAAFAQGNCLYQKPWHQAHWFAK
jgi:SAM-dependent methyltransferase